MCSVCPLLSTVDRQLDILQVLFIDDLAHRAGLTGPVCYNYQAVI